MNKIDLSCDKKNICVFYFRFSFFVESLVLLAFRAKKLFILYAVKRENLKTNKKIMAF